MGTGVASHAVAEIHKEGSAVDGVILDSGGNSTDKKKSSQKSQKNFTKKPLKKL